MRIAIRADSSTHIGSGHIQRCLTLADALRAAGHSILFICADFNGAVTALIQQRGYPVHLLRRETGDVAPGNAGHWLGVEWQQDAQECRAILATQGTIDWLIVDHYGIDVRWEREMAHAAERIMVIDDLANRPHHCDLLLDQTLGRTADDYRPWLDTHRTTEMLLGSHYCLLRPEFRQARKHTLAARNERRQIRNILVTMGGMDPQNISATVLDALEAAKEKPWRVTVVLGGNAPHHAALRQHLDRYHYPVEILSGVDDMAALMTEADLAIGAAGTTSWERCCLGLPTILIQTAANQSEVARQLAASGAALFVGDAQNLDNKAILDALCHASEDLAEIGDAASRVCDGAGATRVADYLGLGSDIQLRPATAADIDTIYQWQIEPGARRYSRNPHPPAYTDHCAWMNRRLSSPDPYLLVMYKGERAGVLRLDHLTQPESYEVSILIHTPYHGRGIGSVALAKLRILHPAITIVAHVQQENAPSQALFTKLGYRFIDGNFYSYPQQPE